MIYNKRFVLEFDGENEKLLDFVRESLEKSVPRGHIPLRFAVVDINGNKLKVSAYILDKKGI